MSETNENTIVQDYQDIGPENFHGPRSDIAIDEAQKKLLDAAITSNDVFNIAITGPLGSGKSTLVRSYESATNKSFAYVSLAAFGQSLAGQDTNGKVVQELEQKIVNQLAVGGDKKQKGLKLSSWKSVGYQPEKVMKNQRRLQGALIFYLLLMVIAIVLVNSFVQMQSAYALQIAISAFIVLACGLAALGIWHTISGCPPMVRSVSVSNARIEMISSRDDETTESFFDRNLAYVLKVFDDRNENVFVFEDMDRIDITDIFEHLRELNKVVNDSSQKREKTTFIYCLRDGMLNGEERSKFFDVIVSVVPYVDGYNSYGKLKDQLEGVSKGISDRFLRNLAMYLGDERTIKALANDYRVFYSKLAGASRESFNREKLLALMAVKASFPVLFEKLEEKSGALYDLLDVRKSAQEEVNPDEDGNRNIPRERLAEAIEKDANDEGKASSTDCRKATDLIYYLISSGRIDEGFYFYLASPDQQALSMNDREWIINARNGVTNFDVDLDSPEHVLDYLEAYDFKKGSMANISLIKWLTNEMPNTPEFNNLVEMLAKYDREPSALSVKQIPRFAAEATKVKLEFFKVVTGLDATPFCLSLVCDKAYNGNEIKDINSKNDDFIRKEFSEKAGSYSEETLNPYVKYEPSVAKRICETMDSLDVRTEITRPTIDQDLYNALLSKSLIKTTPTSCKNICKVIGLGQEAKSDAIERLSKADNKEFWKWVLSHAESFVDDYFEEDEVTINCSVETLDELLSHISDAEKRTLLFNRFDGKIADIETLSNNSDWPAALENGLVDFTPSNMFKYLVQVGADKNWAHYVNEAQQIDTSYEANNEEINKAICNKALLCNELDTDKFDSLCARKMSGCFKRYPSELDESHRAILYRHSLIELDDPHNLTDARSLLSQQDLCVYELDWLDGFLRVSPETGIDPSSEIENLLKNPADKLEDKIPRLVKMIRSKIDLSPNFENPVVNELLKHRKLTQQGNIDAVARFGKCDDLDETIIGFIKENDCADVERIYPPVEVIIKTIPQASPSGKAKLISYAITAFPESSFNALAALQDGTVDELLQRKRPSISTVNNDTKQIIEVLSEHGIVSESKDGRYVMRLSALCKHSRNSPK